MSKSSRGYFQRLKSRLFEQQNGRCCTCGVRMDGLTYSDQTYPTFEHIIPERLHGPRTYENGVLTCLKCNSSEIAWDIWREFCKRENLTLDWHLAIPIGLHYLSYD